jgi:hypothetical protein
VPITTISYDEETRELILERLAQGESVVSICKADGMPNAATVYEWAESPPWGERFARARRIGFENRAERLRDVAAAGERDPACRKVELDYERWLLSKQDPNKFGDRTALQMLDEHGKPAKAGITIVVDGAPGE